MKRKNLYHIQKHYVSIQIPPKGYFYRSTVQFKAPDPSALPRQRLEPDFVPKNESKIQISRVAATSFKGSDIFEKRMKQSNRMDCSSSTGKAGKGFHADNMYRRPRRNLVLNDKPLRPKGKIVISKATKSSFTPKYRNRLSSILTQKLIRANLLQDVGSDVPLKQSEEQEEANSLTKGNITPKCEERKSKDGVQTKKTVTKVKETDEISESSLSESPEKTVRYDVPRRSTNYSLLSFSSDNEADQSSDSTEPVCAKPNFSEQKDTNGEKCLILNAPASQESIEPKTPEFQTPNGSLNASLDPSFYSSERSPGEIEFEDCDGSYDTVEELVDVINTFENFSIVFPKKTFIYHASVKRCDSPKKEKETQSFNENKNNLESIVTAKLMGDIDLHLELENYLKAIYASDETGSCKVRTKNTLQQNHVNCERGENTDFEGSNIIENKLGKSVSAGELNSFGNSENTTEKEKSKREDSVSRQLFNESKMKSSCSFKSAVSVCTPPSSPGDKNRFLVFLDRKIDKFPVSQEYMDAKLIKDCGSHMFLEESKTVKKIRSESDASMLHQDIKAKSHIKRTVGEISFQSPQQDSIPPVLQSVKVQKSLPVSVHKDTQGEPQRISYERISPPEPYYEGKLKANTKSSVLFNNSFCSASADSLKLNKISFECDSFELLTNFPPTGASSNYKFDRRIEETIEEQEQSECVVSERTMINKSPDASLKSQHSTTTLNSNTENWSLQELIEIYNSVLKQNRKIRRCNLKRVKQSISSYLISFIHEKIKDKMHKKELINYAKERIGDSKLRIEEIPNFYEGESKNCGKKNVSELIEYVNRFQEVLSSSLSINQITQLNNIMAGLQDSSLEKPPKIINKKKTSRKIKNATSEEKSSVESSKSKQKTDRRVKKIKDARETISFRTNKIPKRSVSKAATNDKLITVKEVQLPPSAELESVLKSYLTNSQTVKKDSQSGNSAIQSVEKKKNKFLVDVKLCENKIIVKGMRQFQSEKALSKAPLPPGKESSELIIESVSNKQVQKLKCSSKGKSPKSVSLNKNTNTKKKLKKPEVKTPKQGTHHLKTGNKHVKQKSEESGSDEDVIKTKESVSYSLIQRIASAGKVFENEESFIKEFEYNHHLLKIQHPIEAILESSESKISEKTVDNYNELLIAQQESKFHIEGEILREEIDVLSEKDLNALKLLMENSISPNVGSGEEPSVPLPRTKSYLTGNSKKKPGTLFDGEKNFARKKIAKFTKPVNAPNTFSHQNSNKSGVKKKKTILVSRPRSTYLCYPSLQCTQGEKTTKNKKGSKNRKLEDELASSSHGGTVLKTDSSRKGQSKTKVLKNISKGLSNLFRRSSERREQKSKITKSNSNPTTKTILEKKNRNSKITRTIDYQASNSEVEEDDQSKELYSSNRNELNNDSSIIVQNRSFVSLTSSERIAEEPKRTESDKHSTCGGCSNRLKNKNLEGNHSDYCSLERCCNCGLKEDNDYNCARAKRSFTSQNSSGTTDSFKRPMIVIHDGNGNSDDVSFPSLMVLSESFLKCYSSFAISRTKIRSLFKSHSDMKFYPGRVVDSSEEQKPFVTFVLTPKQRDEAGIPDNQTIVVTKPKASEEKFKKDIREEDFHVNFEQITHANSLRAIELFIETLARSRKKACKLREQENKRKKTSQNVPKPKKICVSASKPCSKKYKFTPCRRLQALLTSKRKAYHECQKRLLPNTIKNSIKETFKENSTTTKTQKASQTSPGNANQSQGNELGNLRKIKSHISTEIMKAQVHEAKNNENKLALAPTRSRWIHQKESNNVGNDNTPRGDQNEINLLPEYQGQINIAKNGVESSKTKKRVVEATDENRKTVVLNNDSDAAEMNRCSRNSEYDSERKMQMTKNAKKISPVESVRNCKSVESSGKQMKGINNKKKLKTVKIKISCTKSNSSKPETVEENSYRSFFERIESPENPKSEASAQISDGERELLDSLLLKEEKLENLERKPSVYFDAEENDHGENSEKTDEQRSQEYFFTKRNSLGMNLSAELRDTMPLLKDKRENLMADRPEYNWRSVSSLLDDASKEMDKSSEEESGGGKDIADTEATILSSKKPEPKILTVFNFLNEQTLGRTKTFWNKVKNTISTTDEGRESVQSSSFLFQNSFRLVESFRIKSQHMKFSSAMLSNFNEVFLKLVDYLNAFKTESNMEAENAIRKRKLNNSVTKSSSTCHKLPVAVYQSQSENLFHRTSSGFLIHQTNNLFHVTEALSEFPLTRDESNDRNTLQVLKHRIRKQRLLIQYLANFSALSDIQSVNDKIIKKLRKLEKVVSLLERKL